MGGGIISPLFILILFIIGGCKKDTDLCSVKPGERIVFGVETGSVYDVKAECSENGYDGVYYLDWGSGNNTEVIINETEISADKSIPDTKTSYSGIENVIGGKKIERIDWNDGDGISIYGVNVDPSTPSLAKYKIISPSIGSSPYRSSASVELDNTANPNGLNWGTMASDFYAVYPAVDSYTLSLSDTPSACEVKVQLSQNLYHNNMTFGNKSYYTPSMYYAAMMAVERNVTPTSKVNLKFFPIYTAFDITLGNPSQLNDLEIRKVSLISTSGHLSGKYLCRFDKAAFPNGLKSTSNLSFPASEIENPSNIAECSLYSFSLRKNLSNLLIIRFFVIPEQHNDLSLKVEFTDGSSRTIAFKKSGGAPIIFEPCKKYNIKIGVGGYFLNTENPDPMEWYINGDKNFKVASYKISSSGTVSKVPWHVEGYSLTENGPFSLANKPGWLWLSTENGLGVNSESSIELPSYRISVAPTFIFKSETYILRGRNEVGSASDPIDLSTIAFPWINVTSTVPSNTANCYVVTQPGWYKFPLVYGNAIKNGNPNASAYTSTSPFNNILKNFVRHDGNKITSPWIKDNGFSVSAAEIVWEDWLNNIDHGTIAVDGNYIKFQIKQDNIHEGNNVIAAKDASGNILWSWNIWVTSQTLSAIPVQNNWVAAGSPAGGKEYFQFLSENLGASSGGEQLDYAERKIYVKLTNDKKSSVICLEKQSGRIAASGYASPYYQYGRKDPFYPADGLTSTGTKTCFDKDGNIIEGTGTGGSASIASDNWNANSASSANIAIANMISKPQVFNNAQERYYINLWTTNVNTTSITDDLAHAVFIPSVKTVYDPSPAGFVIPPNGAFTGFTNTGMNISGSSWSGIVPAGINMSSFPSTALWFFHTRLGRTGGTILFHPCGGRHHEDGPINEFYFSTGSYCTSTKVYNKYSFIFSFQDYFGTFACNAGTSMNTAGNSWYNNDYYASNVRPVAEN